MSIHESPEAQLDRESLSHLYYSTGGQRWTRSTNWLSPAPLGSWFGVKTDSYGRVVELNLSGNGLRDNLSPKIRNLTKLTCLNLSNNYLGEPVAGSKRAWNGVLMLFLGHNRRVARSEGLPQELGSITDLHVLDLSHNSYRWEIPSTLVLQSQITLHSFSGCLDERCGQRLCLVSEADFTSPVEPEMMNLEMCGCSTR